MKKKHKGKVVSEYGTSTIVDVIIKYSKEIPDDVAVVDQYGSVSYKQLNLYSNEIACLLSKKTESRFIGVLLPRINEYIISIIGIMKAGMAYVPLDESLPLHKKNEIIDDSGIDVLITSKILYEASSLSIKNVYYIEDILGENDTDYNCTEYEGVAALMYTSGSTGKPKGVLVPHRVFTSMAEWFVPHLRLKTEKRTALALNFSYAASFPSIYAPLFAGGTAYIVPEQMCGNHYLELCAFINDNEITTIATSTPIGIGLLKQPFLKLKYMAVGGDKLEVVGNHKVTIYNIYGATENLMATYHCVTGDEGNVGQLLGEPMYNSRIIVLDNNGKEVAKGEEGEICVAGKLMALGYWGKADLTKEKFVDYTDENRDSFKVYKTGDVGYWNNEDELVYKGRVDNMKKINGVRIELGEIEHYVRLYDGIDEAAVVYRENVFPKLVCYYTGEEIPSVSLHNHLQGFLSLQVIPSAFVHIQQIPKNTSGKIDRLHLMNLSVKTADVTIIKPTNEKETLLWLLCSEHLHFVDFGINTNLQSLGLTSQEAGMISSELLNAHNYELSPETIMRQPFISKLSELLTHIKPKTAEKQSYYLAENQKGLYYECVNKQTLKYNVSFCIDVSPYEPQSILNAVNSLLDAHPILSCSIKTDQNNLVFVQHKRCLDKLEFVVGDKGNINRYLTPISVNEGPLSFFKLYKTETNLFLLCDIHHIVFDGLSVDPFVNDLFAVLQKGQSLNNDDYVFEWLWKEQSNNQREQISSSQKYFEELLGDNSFTHIQGDLSSKNGAKIGCEHIFYEINREPIENYCRLQDVTPNSYFATVLLEVIRQIVNQDEVLIATIHGGRMNDAKSIGKIGMFVKTIPIIGKFKGRDLCQNVKAIHSQLNDTFGHLDYPFSQIVELADNKPGIIYVFEGGVNTQGMVMPIDCPESKFPLAFSVLELVKGKYTIKLEFESSIYSRQFAERLLEMVVTFATNAINENYRLLTMDEEEAILNLSKGKELTIEKGKTVVDYIVSNAKKAPDAWALVYNNQFLSYGELDRKSNILANLLISKGVGKGKNIIIELRRGLEYIVSIIAVLKSGAAYIPVSIKEKGTTRLVEIKKNSGCYLTITNDEVENNIESGDYLYYNRIDFTTSNLIDKPINYSDEQSVAYIIYTSGSTGIPKGVMISHAALASLVTWQVDEFRLSDEKSNLSVADYGYDASVPDIFSPLCAGGVVHIMDERNVANLKCIYEYICCHHITGMTISTQLGLDLLDRFQLPLEYIMLGGDKFRHVKYDSNISIYNGYGPTEFTVCSSFARISHDGKITIGRPVPNSSSLVLSKDGYLLPRGFVGELCLVGNQLSLGYYNDTEKTGKSFVECSYFPGALMYKTGDYARWDNDGNLEYVGREDNRVKLNGYRVELEEIENVILKNYIIERCITFIKTNQETQKDQLICLYEACTDINFNRLRDFLPQHMIPAFFIKVASGSIRVTENGKIDRVHLPSFFIPPKESILPTTPTEEIIVKIISAVANVENLGVNYTMKEIGVNSQERVEISQRLAEEYGMDVPIIDEYDTVNSISIKAKDIKSVVASDRVYFPLASNQREIYVSCQNNAGRILYNIPVVLELAGIEAETLKDSVFRVLKKHSFLLSTIEFQEGQPMLRRCGNVDISIPVVPLDSIPDKEFFQSQIRPFDLNTGEPLVRFSIFKYKDTSYLLSDIHHIVFDGVSERIFFSDIIECCYGKAIKNEFLTYFEHIEDLENASDNKENDRDYFIQILKNASNVEVPKSAHSEGQHKERVVRMLLPQNNSLLIRNFCNTYGLSNNIFFLTVTTQLLIRYLYAEGIVVNVIFEGREGKYNNTVGMFVRTIPFVTSFETDFSQAALSNEKQWKETLLHSKYPYQDICQDNNISPTILFSYDADLSSETITSVNHPHKITILDLDCPKVPLSIAFSNNNGCYELVMEYDSCFYDGKEIETMGPLLIRFINQICQEYNLPRKGLSSIINVDEVIRFSYGGKKDFKPLTFVEMFENSVRTNRHKLALVDEEGSFTYEELWKRCNGFSCQLRTAGVKKGDFVGILTGSHGKEFVVVAISVLKLGAAYVPIETIDGRVIEKCGINTIVCLENDDVMLNNAIVVVPYREEQIDKVNMEAINDSDYRDCAYVIFTSGSTGEPKGVSISNAALSTFIQNIVSLYKLNDKDRILCQSSYTFDASVEDMLPVLTVGGTVYCIKENPRKDIDSIHSFICTHKITGGSCTTKLGTLLLTQYPDLPVRYFTVGGEKMTSAPNSNCELYNVYGPTEFTVDATYYKLEKERNYNDIPIGRPFPGLYALVMDKERKLLPIGAIGRLFLVGPQISNGYINDEEQTRDKIVQNPYMDALMYDTGDIVRWGVDGQLYYLGRDSEDTQIKINGYRVDVGAIETAVSSYPGIKEAVVSYSKENKHLCCFYISDQKISVFELRQFLLDRIPVYMIPIIYEHGENDLVYLSSGKIDRKYYQKRSDDAKFKRITPYSAPSTTMETLLCEVFGEVFNTEELIGVNDHYIFDLGGNSLSPTEISICCRSHGINVLVEDVNRLCTPRNIAAFIERGGCVIHNEIEMINNTIDLPSITETLSKQIHGEVSGAQNLRGDRILLTGATGFLGIHILELLIKEKCLVTCVVREENERKAKERLKSIYKWYFQKSLPEDESIKVIASDLSLFELDDDTQFTYVINCAAVVKHYVTGDVKKQLFDTNVEAVKKLIAISQRTNAKLIQISSTSIAGFIKGTEQKTLTENDFYIGQLITNDYVASKYEAEGLVLGAISRGEIKGKIMRLGNLMPRYSDGVFQINKESNAFLNYLKSIIHLGLIDASTLDVDVELSPIDEVADMIVQIIKQEDESIVFHICNPNTIKMCQLVEQIKNCGNNVKEMQSDEFQKEIANIAKDEKRNVFLQGFLHYETHSEGAVSNAISAQQTLDYLEKRNIRWADINDQYLQLLIRLAQN